MGFRDDNEALRQKVRALEEQVETLTEELEEVRTPKVRVPEPLPDAPAGDLDARIAAREALRAQQAVDEEAKARKQLLKNQQGPREVRVQGDPTNALITIHRPLTRQLRLVGHIAAAGAVPGSLFMVGIVAVLSETLSLGAAIGLVATIYFAIVLAITILAAQLSRPRIELRVTKDNFELKQAGQTKMFGRRADLQMRVYEPTSKRRGHVYFRHENERITISELGLADTMVLQPFAPD